MKRHRRLDDRSTDALMRGRSVEGEPALSAFVTGLHQLGQSPSPAPSDALAAMLAAGVAREDRVAVAPDEQPVVEEPAASTRRAPWLSKPLVGMAAAVLAVLGGAQANALPAPAQDAVATAVSWVTPLDLPHSDDDHDGRQPDVAPTSGELPASPTHRPAPTAVPSASPTSRPAVVEDDEPTQERTEEPTEPEESDEPIADATEEPLDEPAEEPTEEEPVDEPTEDPEEESSDEDPLGLGAILPRP